MGKIAQFVLSCSEYMGYWKATMPAFLSTTLFLRHLATSCWHPPWLLKGFFHLETPELMGVQHFGGKVEWTPHTPTCTNIFSCSPIWWETQEYNLSDKQPCINYPFCPIFQIPLLLGSPAHHAGELKHFIPSMHCTVIQSSTHPSYRLSLQSFWSLQVHRRKPEDVNGS